MRAKPRTRRWAGALAGAMALMAAGCDGGLEAGGASEGKCAYVVKYEGRSYLDERGRSTTDRKFTVGESLGTGLLPGCDESGGADGAEAPEKVTVYEVEGIAPAVAVAAGKTPAEAVLVAVQGADLAPLDAAS